MNDHHERCNTSELYEQLSQISERLRRSEQLKSQFLSNVRNEMVNPLTCILGLTRLLLKNGDALPVKVRNTTSLLFREAFQLDFQIRNILTAAELEAGVTIPSLTRVNIRSLIEGTIDAFRFRLNEKGINVNVRCDLGYQYQTYTDDHLLFLILTNLLANAIEFSLQGSEILISLTHDESMVHIAFRDFGPGIPDCELKWIFDRFNQVDMSSTKNHRGQGLGLAVVGGLTEILQGSIHVENSSPGSTFLLSIPIRSNEPISIVDWSERLFESGEEL